MSRYIDADKVLEKMENTFDMQDLYLPIHFKELIIDDMPTADVRPNVHGEWIKTGRTNIYGGFEIECSVCHTTLMVSHSRWEIGENFCDVCGADMRKGKPE